MLFTVLNHYTYNSLNTFFGYLCSNLYLMNKKFNNVAFLVFACDRYQFLYQGFDYFFKKNIPSNVVTKAYFATEELSCGLDHYKYLKSGKGEWTNRLKVVLDQIDEEYIIFLQEDMWFTKKVSETAFSKIINYAVNSDLSLLKLHSADIYKTISTNHDIDGFELTKLDKKHSEFLMSHQVSIWKRSFFRDQLKDNEHPWRNERKGTKRLRKSPVDIYQMDLFSENHKEPNNQNTSNEHGAYLTISENACIHPRTKELLGELQVDLPDYAKKIQYHMDNELTHDGKERPRKKDFTKSVKNGIYNWFKTK